MDTKKCEVDINELEKVNGGGILDFVDDVSNLWGCFWNGHSDFLREKKLPQGTGLKFSKFVCERCGRVFYEKVNPDGTWGECSQSEYDSY